MQAPAVIENLPQEGALVPADTVNQFTANPEVMLAHAEKVAKALKKFLNRKAPGKKVHFNGEQYPKNEDWLFVAAFFGHTPRVRSTTQLVDDDGKPFGYHAVCDLVNGQGRVVSSAEARCTRDERNWQTKPDFQLLSMSQTRASSKACGNVFRWVMVMAGLEGTPAEEMVQSEPYAMCKECGEDIWDSKDVYASKKAVGKVLCRICLKTNQGDKIMEPLKDPQFVQKSAEKINAARDRTIRGVASV